MRLSKETVCEQSQGNKQAHPMTHERAAAQEPCRSTRHYRWGSPLLVANERDRPQCVGSRGVVLAIGAIEHRAARPGKRCAVRDIDVYKPCQRGTPVEIG